MFNTIHDGAEHRRLYPDAECCPTALALLTSYLGTLRIRLLPKCKINYPSSQDQKQLIYNCGSDIEHTRTAWGL